MSKDTQSTNGSVDLAFKKVMEETGFYRHDKPAPDVIEASTLLGRDPRFLDKYVKYKAFVDRTKLHATAIYELSGSPCIYFTSLSQSDPDPRELIQLRKMAWNQGLAILWIVTPTKVLLYNSYAKPTFNEEKTPDQHLLAMFQQTAEDLRKLNEFAGRLQFETGSFWQHEQARRIRRAERVDQALLADLEEAEKNLVKKKLAPAIAHALLGRSIFVAYLQDRGILGPDFFQSRFHLDNFAELLMSDSAKDATYDGIFDWLKTTFNGDLFPLQHTNEYGQIVNEKDVIENSHLFEVGKLLSGVHMRTGQGRLWPYKFDMIPIELISSIYEKFLHASNTQKAQEQGTYYTPLNLVDMVLAETCQNVSGHANVLDLACGSGVFLVEALRRLVARRIANGEEWSRELVRDVLYRQIYGVDISPEAIEIAAFSLYLTALELDPDPQALENIRFQTLHEKNLFVADAFDEHATFNRCDPFAKKDFQMIVGNPPWRRTKANELAEEYCKQHHYPIARRSLDQAFLWRIADFTNEKTKIGLILHSNPLFSHTEEAQKAREQLFKRFAPHVFVNLSALRQDDLFPHSTAPATILIAKGQTPQENNTFFVVNVEHSDTFKLHHGIIEIGPENIKKVTVRHLYSDNDILKIASWGSARDMALLTRLRSMFPALGSLVKQPGEVKIRKDEWLGGQGFQEAGGTKEELKLVGKKWLPAGKMTPFIVDTSELGEIPAGKKFHRPRDPRIYEAPLVITPRGLGIEGFFASFSPTDIVYTEEYYGISFPARHEHYARYITGILNSSLANYFLFLTAATWGIERDEIKPNDLLRFPLPELTSANEQIIARIIEITQQLTMLHTPQNIAHRKAALDDAVFELYGLDDIERILVHDFLNFTLALRMKGAASGALERPSSTELETYGTQLINTIQPFFRTLNQSTVVADIFETRHAPLQVIRFSIVPVPGRTPGTQVVSGKPFEDVLEEIAAQLPAHITGTFHMRRHLRIYNGKDFYIIKPAQRRYWSRSAALNDADTILEEQMKRNYASVR
jgi:type I restriction-modification system DNA methylase subunit